MHSSYETKGIRDASQCRETCSYFIRERSLTAPALLLRQLSHQVRLVTALSVCCPAAVRRSLIRSRAEVASRRPWRARRPAWATASLMPPAETPVFCFSRLGYSAREITSTRKRDDGERFANVNAQSQAFVDSAERFKQEIIPLTIVIAQSDGTHLSEPGGELVQGVIDLLQKFLRTGGD